MVGGGAGADEAGAGAAGASGVGAGAAGAGVDEFAEAAPRAAPRGMRRDRAPRRGPEDLLEDLGGGAEALASAANAVAVNEPRTFTCPRGCGSLLLHRHSGRAAAIALHLATRHNVGDFW
jgi:hypothetical protein